MLVIMGDLMTLSVGTLFTAAILPGLLLAGIYLVYIGIFAVAASPRWRRRWRRTKGRRAPSN